MQILFFNQTIFLKKESLFSINAWFSYLISEFYCTSLKSIFVEYSRRILGILLSTFPKIWVSEKVFSRDHRFKRGTPTSSRPVICKTWNAVRMPYKRISWGWFRSGIWIGCFKEGLPAAFCRATFWTILTKLRICQHQTILMFDG